jgi:hypothetical protein
MINYELYIRYLRAIYALKEPLPVKVAKGISHTVYPTSYQQAEKPVKSIICLPYDNL